MNYRTGASTPLRLTVLCLLISSIYGVSPARAIADDVPWDVAAVGEARIAVPEDWTPLDNFPRHMPAYWQGGGFDETKSPLQIGMTLEKFPMSGSSLNKIMDGLVANAKSNPRLEMIGEPSIEKVTLSDAREAMLLTAEFIKEGHRRSLQMKLVTKGADSTVWIASGFLVGSKESRWPSAESRLAQWVRAHVLTFTLDPQRVDSDALRSAYKEFAPKRYRHPRGN